jgi:hypothetical protein
MTLEEQPMSRCQQVNDYRVSGQTAVAWCSENNLNINTLRYWLTKYNRKAKANLKQETFIELKQTSVNEVPVIVKIGAVHRAVFRLPGRDSVRCHVYTPVDSFKKL